VTSAWAGSDIDLTVTSRNGCGSPVFPRVCSLFPFNAAGLQLRWNQFRADWRDDRSLGSLLPGSK